MSIVISPIKYTFLLLYCSKIVFNFCKISLTSFLGCR